MLLLKSDNSPAANFIVQWNDIGNGHTIFLQPMQSESKRGNTSPQRKGGRVYAVRLYDGEKKSVQVEYKDIYLKLKPLFEQLSDREAAKFLSTAIETGRFNPDILNKLFPSEEQLAKRAEFKAYLSAFIVITQVPEEQRTTGTAEAVNRVLQEYAHTSGETHNTFSALLDFHDSTQSSTTQAIYKRPTLKSMLDPTKGLFEFMKRSPDWYQYPTKQDLYLSPAAALMGKKDENGNKIIDSPAATRKYLIEQVISINKNFVCSPSIYASTSSEQTAEALPLLPIEISQPLEQTKQEIGVKRALTVVDGNVAGKQDAKRLKKAYQDLKEQQKIDNPTLYNDLEAGRSYPLPLQVRMKTRSQTKNEQGLPEYEIPVVDRDESQAGTSCGMKRLKRDIAWQRVVLHDSDQTESSIVRHFLQQSPRSRTRRCAERVRWITTENPIFMQISERFGSHLQNYKAHLTQLRSHTELPSGEGGMGLNAMAWIQSIISSSDHQTIDKTDNPGPLKEILQAQVYLNLVQLSKNSIEDLNNIRKLANSLIKSAQAERQVLQTSALEVSHVLTSVGKTLSTGVDFIIGGAMIALDGAQLANVNTEEEKNVAITKMSFDSLNFLMSGSSLVLSAIGGETALTLAGATMVLGVPVAGLGIGVTELVAAYSKVANNIQAVGHFFDALRRAYNAGGWEWDSENKILKPLVGVVTHTLDLRHNKVILDSQKILSSRTGLDHSTIADLDKAINILKDGICYGRTDSICHDFTATLPPRPSSDYSIILPITAQSIIDYRHNFLPGAEWRTGPGFTVMRNMDHTGRFKATPTGWGIDQMTQRYRETIEKIFLDEYAKRIQMPDFPPGLSGYMVYELYSAPGSSTHIIYLNKGAALTLDAQNQPTTWVLDAGNLHGTAPLAASIDRLSIGGEIHGNTRQGGITIKLQNNAAARIILINKNGEINQISFNNDSATSTVTEEDEAHWKARPTELLEHLAQLVQTHQLAKGQLVAIHNHHVGDKYVGNAFYDTSRKHVWYVNPTDPLLPDPEIIKQLSLAMVQDDHAYFYHTASNFLARTSSENGHIEELYKLPTSHIDSSFGGLPAVDRYYQHFANVGLRSSQLRRVWVENDALLFSWELEDRRQQKVEFVYMIYNKQVMLTAIRDCPAVVINNLQEEIETNQTKETQQASGKTPIEIHTLVNASEKTAEWLSLSGNDLTGQRQRYWIRSSDGFILKPNLPPSSSEVSLNKQDLILAGVTPSTDPQVREIFYLFDPHTKIVYRQKAQHHNTATEPAEALNISNLARLTQVGDMMVATNTEGEIRNISRDDFPLIGVSAKWLQQHRGWQNDFNVLSLATANQIVNVMGYQDQDGNNLPAWAYNDQLIIAERDHSGRLGNRNIELMGIHRENNLALLFDHQTGAVLTQQILTPAELANAFSNTQLRSDYPLPMAEVQFADIKKADKIRENEFRLTNKEGLYLHLSLLQTNLSPQCVGVNKQWQSEHADNFMQSLADLGRRYAHKETIVLEKGPHSEPAWYHFASKTLITGYGLSVSAQPVLLGTYKHHTYIHTRADGRLWILERNSVAREIGRVNQLQYLNNAVLLEAHPQNYDHIVIPPIAGIQTAIVTGTARRDHYRIDQAAWDHYQTIIIDNRDEAELMDRLLITIAERSRLIISQNGEDVVIYDPVSQKSIVVRQALRNSLSAHLEIQTGDSVNAVVTGQPPSMQLLSTRET